MDVSVIVPFFNSGRYLRRCLESLKDQKGVSAEFICVDDGSTDDSSDICMSFVERDGRFRYLRQEQSGVSVARNRGLDEAEGKYVCFVDSDDILRKDALRRLFDMAEEHNCDCVKFNARIVHGERWMKRSFRKHDELIEDFRPECIFNNEDTRPFIWSHFILTEALRGKRFDTDLSIGEDQEFIIRYMSEVRRVLFCSDRLYVHICHDDSNLSVIRKDPNLLFRNHMVMVDAVSKYMDGDVPGYMGWAFDALYRPYADSSFDPDIGRGLLSFLESKGMIGNLDDSRKDKLKGLIGSPEGM